MTDEPTLYDVHELVDGVFRKYATLVADDADDATDALLLILADLDPDIDCIADHYVIVNHREREFHICRDDMTPVTTS